MNKFSPEQRLVITVIGMILFTICTIVIATHRYSYCIESEAIKAGLEQTPVPGRPGSTYWTKSVDKTLEEQ